MPLSKFIPACALTQFPASFEYKERCYCVIPSLFTLTHINHVQRYGVDELQSSNFRPVFSASLAKSKQLKLDFFPPLLPRTLHYIQNTHALISLTFRQWPEAAVSERGRWHRRGH